MAGTEPTCGVAESQPRLRSLRSIIFRFTLAPALMLALLLGLLFTLQQIHDRRQLLLSHGLASAKQLAAFIYMSGDPPTDPHMEQLQQNLLPLMLEKDMVRSVQIYTIGDITEGDSSSPRLLAGVGPQPQRTIPMDALRGTEPFVYEDSNGLQVLQPLDNDPLTWLSIELYRPYFIVGTYQVLLVGLLGLIICTLAAVTWSVFLSERMVTSLKHLGEKIRAIGRGQFNTRAHVSNNLELHRLAEQINHMAVGLATHQRDYETYLYQSMEDLRQSLDSMEEQNIELELEYKKALEASRVKSDFLADTTHEIRTPLNGIIGFTNLLLKTDIDELQQDYLQTILNSSENLLTTINDILDFSRIEAGNLVLDHIPMNLGQLLEETLQILTPFAYERRLELVPLIDTQLPETLIGDPLRIKQVLTNLVSNAIRHSEGGNIPVRVSVQSSRESELLMRISVTDLGNCNNGQGRQELQQLIEWEPQQVNRQLSSDGLGLAIVRSLIERMRGSIGVDETAGGSATFWVHIPLLLDRNRTVPARDRFPGCSLLLADPNRMTRMQVSQLLKHWQVEPVELTDTSTLQPAVEQMWRHDALPDAIIVDTAIASGDFEQFIATMKQLVDTCQCRLIIQGSPVELRRCYEQLRTRALTFLAKPVTRDNLLRALRRVAPQQGEPRQVTGYPKLPGPAAPRVLAVDDNESNRLLVGELLRAQGIEAVVATSGEEAVRLWREQDFDLIFMDIQMPNMDGIAATRLIRQEESARRIPIIALTAHVGTEEKARLLSAGLDDYLSKPVSEAQLSHMIKRWMKIVTPGKSSRRKIHEPRLFDISESLRLSNNDAKLARDLLRMLVKGLVHDEQELNRLNNAGDHRTLFELVHRLHGGCSYCGVPRLRQATAKLQEQLRPLQDCEAASIDQQLLQTVVYEIRALREWASEQNLDALFGLEAIPEQS